MNKFSKVDTSAVVQQVPLEFVDASGDIFTLGAEFRFHPSDPLAVTAVFRTGTQEVVWTFGRDLLIEGRFEPVGDGDVHVWPCLSSAGSAVVVIELVSPDGELMVQANSRLVQDFVAAMLQAVPLGAERVDVDALLSSLFA